jgi:hypothetical protein
MLSIMFKYITTAALLLLALTSPAQTPGPGGGPVSQEPDTTPPTSVPIDGGASLLLASGVAYGIKRLRRKRS